MRCRCKCDSQQDQQLTVPRNKSRYYYQDTFDDVPLNERKTITDVPSTGKTQNIKRVQESQNKKEIKESKIVQPSTSKDVKQSQNKKEIKESQSVQPSTLKDVKQSQKQPEESEEYEEQEVIVEKKETKKTFSFWVLPIPLGGGGQNNKIFIQHRWRRVHVINREKYVNIKGRLIKLKQIAPQFSKG